MTSTYEPEPHLKAGRLWAGGLATAVVAALIAIVGILIARGLLDIDVVAPQGAGDWRDADMRWYAFGAALAAVAATGLMQVLIIGTPQPARFFGWVVALATVVAAVFPLVTGADLASRIYTSVLNLVLGAAIGSLVSGTARMSMRYAGEESP